VACAEDTAEDKQSDGADQARGSHCKLSAYWWDTHHAAYATPVLPVSATV
jgi:hypothetical protein